MRYILPILLGLLISFSAQAQKDTFSVHFDMGVSRLDKDAVFTIDSLLYHDILRTDKKLGIIGYADYVGSEQSNENLSERRAESVKDYLNGMGITDEYIQIVMGKGEVARAGMESNEGYREDRRVDIIPGGFTVIDTPKVTSPKPAAPPAAKIDITKTEKNQTIRLNNIFFLPGRHIAREDSRKEMLQLYQTMKDNPNLKIRIEGHICCLPPSASDGFDEDTEDFHLSRNRAQYIYNYLVFKGISKDRVDYVGFGPTKPLVSPEKTVDDENMNRRVEIRILEK